MAAGAIKAKREVNPPSTCHSAKQKGILLSATKPLTLALTLPPAMPIKRFANPADLLFSEVKNDQQSAQSSQVQTPAAAATCIDTQFASSFPICTIPVMSSLQSGFESVVYTSIAPASFVPSTALTQPALPLYPSGPVFQASPYLMKDIHDSNPSHLNFVPIQANLNPPKAESEEKRPQYSYSALIAMAILSSPNKMLTLPEIYDFISWRFPFYKTGNKKWKNSVRHTLSLNKCFTKSSRESSTQGKGNYWIIDPLCDHILENGTFRSPSKTRRGNRKRQGRNDLNEGNMPADLNIHKSGRVRRNIVSNSNPSPSSGETVGITAMERHNTTSGDAVKTTGAYKYPSNFGVDRLLS